MTPDALPPEAINDAAQAEREWKRGAGLPDTETGYDTGRIRAMLEAAAPHLAAAEREACAQLAESLKFRLYRPGNGPGAGQQALDVVPLGELLGHLRKDDHAAA